MKPVIICGGIGSKMWPMSRSSMPKHFLPIWGKKSLFQLNYETLRLEFEPKDIFVQTNAVQALIAKKQVPEIPKENYFIEPEMRNQGPATGFAAAMLYKKFPNEPFILVQADVLRTPCENFLKMIRVVDEIVKKNNKYVTGGFRTDRIVGGVDYLIKGDLVLEKFGVKIYNVAGYIDRIEREKIKKYMDSDKLLLHANHTAMKSSDLLDMFETYKPEWSVPLKAIIDGADVAKEYAKMPKGAIEDVTKLVYEKGDALVVELPFEWIDFGTWESVASFLQSRGLYNPDEDVMEIDSNNNFIYKKGKKFIATVGIKNSIIVDTGDALLVIDRSQTGKVGQIVDALKMEKREELL